MVSKSKPESFMVTAIKCTTILLQLVLIGAKYHGNLNNIDQCILCAYCEPTHQGINETRSICTDPANVPNLTQPLKYECYRHGDLSELMYHDEKSSDISLISPSGEKDICYFNISYYNFSRAHFVEVDTVFVDYRENYTVSNEWNDKWKVKQKETYHAHKFRVLALTGRGYLF